jgi:hypothetical protein
MVFWVLAVVAACAAVPLILLACVAYAETFRDDRVDP